MLAATWLWVTACGGGQRPPVTAMATHEHVQRGEAAERSRAYDEARAHYQVAVDTAPDPGSRAFAARKFGRALIFWGELDNGARQLSLSLDNDRNDPGTWHDLAMVEFSRGNVPQAETAFRHAKRLAPGDPRPRIALAAMLWKSGQLAPALVEYRALAKLDLPPKLASAVAWAIARLEEKRSAAPTTPGQELSP